MMSLFADIERSALGVWMRESPSVLAFPFVLYLHTLGLAMLAGLNVGLDCWLLGRRTVPSIRLANVYRIMWLGFGINFVSGLMLLAAYPAKALTNWVFFVKMGLVVLAMWVLERLKGELAVANGNTRELGTPARALAVLSLGWCRGGWPSWLGAPELHVAALAIVLARSAAAGIDALGTGHRRAITCLLVSAGCVVVALVALIVLRTRHEAAAAPIDRALLDAGLGIVCMAAAIVLASKQPKRRLPIVFALLVVPGVGARPSIAPMTHRDPISHSPSWVGPIPPVVKTRP